MKYFLSFLFLLLTICSFAQTSPKVVHRASTAVTTSDGRLRAELNLYVPHTRGLTLNGGLDTLGAMIYDDSSGHIWYRDTVLTGGHQWKQLEDHEPEQIVGSIYNNANFTSLSGFINRGATVSATGGHLAFIGGSPNTQTLELDTCRSIENWVMGTKAKVISAGSGFGLGLRTTNTTLAYSIEGKFNTTDGKIYLYSGPFSLVATSTSSISFSLNDSIEFVVELDKTILRARARNLSTNSAAIYVEYNFYSSSTRLPNTGRFSIFANGGDFNVDSLSIWSKTPKNPALIFFGDSKQRFYTVSSEGFRTGDLLNNFGRSCVILAGSGDKTLEFLSRYKEVLSIAGPRTKVILNGCSNDPRNGVDSATYCHQYDSLVNLLTSAGVDVYHTTGYWEPNINQNPLSNHIYQTYPLNKIIETLVPTNQPSLLVGDNIHMNDVGNKLAFDIIVQSGKLPELSTIYDAGNTVIRNQNSSYQPGYIKVLGTISSWSLASGTTPPTTTGTLRKVVSDTTGLISHRQLDFISIADYNVKSNDTTVDYTSTIQSVLNTGARTVLIPAGSYIITSTLRVKSYQTILAYGARFKRAANITAVLINDADGVTGRYAANKDIKILGLTIDGNASNFSTSHTLIAFGHACNITIKDCDFYNSVGLSLVEINGCKNTLIQNSNFHDAVLTGTECIRTNLMLNSSAFQWFGPYDSVAVDGLTIRDCSIRNGDVGIGQHGVFDYTHPIKNVLIDNCNIFGINDRAIRPYNFQNLTVNNCKIDSCTQGIYDLDINFNNPYGLQRNLIITNNIITRTTVSAGDGRPIQAWGWKNIIVTNNIVDSMTRHGIGIGYNSDTFLIANNVVRKFGAVQGGTGYGIVIWGARNGTIDGNTIICDSNIADRNAIVLNTAIFEPKNISITNNIVRVPFRSPSTVSNAFNQGFPLFGTNIYVGRNIVNDTAVGTTKLITSNYTIVGTEGVINANTTSGAITITLLPRFLNDGITILKSAGSNLLTVTTGSGTINGQSSITVESNVTLKSDGFNYYTVGGTQQYKKYVATISQTGTNAPIVTELENTLGTTMTFGYTSTGVYTATASSSVFTTGKTFILIGNSNGSTLGNMTYVSRSSDTQIGLKTSNLSTATDGILNETTIEIRVYP